METTYTLKDFEAISFQQDVLSEYTIRVIQSLCGMFEQPAVENTSSYNTSSSGKQRQKDIEYNGEKHFKKKQSANDWKPKPIYISKFATLNDNQATINEIRTIINKLTTANHMEKIGTIKDKMSDIDEDVDIENVLSTIYSISVSNKMNIDIHVNVWSMLFEEFQEHVVKIFETKFSEYREGMKNIVDVSSDNYDDFCDFTTKNTVRKNMTELLSKLARSGSELFTKDKITTLVEDLLNQVEIDIEIKDKQKEVEELTENAMILFSEIKATNTELFATYLPRIRLLSGYKTGEKPGLPPRSKFKYMDLVGK